MSVEEVSHLLDLLWVVFSAGLVFFMQAGFLAFEVGAVRRKNTGATAFKNIGDWVTINLVFFLVGYGLMFGDSVAGFIGVDHFVGMDLGDGTTMDSREQWVGLLFQMAFASTAATVVSGAMAERTTFKAYLIFTVMMAALIYPVYGHWVWNDNGWLKSLGYMDFAGSSVVHLVGAVASLVGIKIVGPRLGRYARDGSVTPLEVNSSSWSALGVLILWFGWWGFNGGSTLEFSGAVVPIIINTNIAGAAAGIVGFFHARSFQGGEHLEEKFMGSALGGLVAITACCDVVSPAASFAIGAGAALVHNYSYDLVLRRWRLDDVVAASPVHGFCGIWGILALPFFAEPGTLAAGNMLVQFGVQIVGVATCVIWVGSLSFVFIKLIDKLVGLRVSPMQEIRGLGIGAESRPEEVNSEFDDALFQAEPPPQGQPSQRFDTHTDDFR
ncbi:ammonium transporter [Haliangium ochraceum]|nr:ammonium transporter [Haliangium ochraceum]